MKKKMITLLAALTLTVGIGVTAFAAGSTSLGETGRANNVGLGLGRIINIRGYEINNSILKEKLGFTDEQITEGLNEGKSYLDLAEEKGMTLDQFKEAALSIRTEAIDEAVNNGTITKEDGENFKNRIEANSQNCDGTCNGQGQGGQMRGKGLGGRIGRNQ